MLAYAAFTMQRYNIFCTPKKKRYTRDHHFHQPATWRWKKGAKVRKRQEPAAGIRTECVIIGLGVVLQGFEGKRMGVVDNSFRVIRKVMCTLAA